MVGAKATTGCRCPGGERRAGHVALRQSCTSLLVAKYHVRAADAGSVKTLRYGILAAGLALLVVSFVFVVMDARDDRHAETERMVATDADAELARLDEYFDRSAAVVGILSQNPAFRTFYELSGTREDKVRDPAAVEELNRALAHLEELYPASIGEACFIDAGGAENARVVRGEVAGPADLSLDETGAAFFAPTFALDVGDVYQSAPYESPDTGEWVVANSTLVPFADGAKRAIVHFEITMDSFRHLGRDTDARMRIVDAAGSVLVDSDRAQEVDAPLGWPEQRGLQSLSGRLEPDSSYITVVGNELVAVRSIRTGLVTPNEWYLVVSEPVHAGSATPISLPALLLLLGGSAVLIAALGSLFAHERKLQVQATTDALTGLPNRTLFADRVAQAIRFAQREDHSLAVLLLDIDRFKEVNDTLGHHRGDQLLGEFAARLSGGLRGVDTIARLGGDEFAVLLPKTAGLAGAVDVCERLADVMADEVWIDGLPIHCDASIGIALYPEHGETGTELMQHADVAMYRAKRSGVPFCVYSSEHDPHSAQRLAMISELRTGIDRGELVLHYQPKIDLPTRQFISAEALVRWEHPSLGLLAPGDFLPLAEVSGLLRPLTNVVMTTAFSQVAAWSARGWDLTMAVNISPRSLSDPTFLEDLNDAIAHSGARPEQIVIEITEDTLFSEPEASRRALDEISRRGFAISIDDFGTGYSSLSYLRELPVDEVKIDRTFIGGLNENVADQAIVGSTIALAHSLGYRVVAEGIETAISLELLVGMGCDLGQGFHLGRPVPREDFETALIETAAYLR